MPRPRQSPRHRDRPACCGLASDQAIAALRASQWVCKSFLAVGLNPSSLGRNSLGPSYEEFGRKEAHHGKQSQTGRCTGRISAELTWHEQSLMLDIKEI